MVHESFVVGELSFQLGGGSRDFRESKPSKGNLKPLTRDFLHDQPRQHYYVDGSRVSVSSIQHI